MTILIVWCYFDVEGLDIALKYRNYESRIISIALTAAILMLYILVWI